MDKIIFYGNPTECLFWEEVTHNRIERHNLFITDTHARASYRSDMECHDVNEARRRHCQIVDALIVSGYPDKVPDGWMIAVPKKLVLLLINERLSTYATMLIK